MEANYANQVTPGKRVTILSIDGGGIRGVIPATILEYFEEQLQLLDGPDARIADYFDVISGTSTGALIGGILTAPNDNGRPRFTAADAMKFYTEDGAKIFANRCFPIITQLIGPKHDANVLEKVLKDTLQDLKMKDTITELIIPTFDINLMQPTYFSTSEAKQDELKDAYLRDVLRGTSAAPTYFAPYFFQTTSTSKESRAFNLVDGGVGMNNPAYISIMHTLYQMSKKNTTQSGGPITLQAYNLSSNVTSIDNAASDNIQRLKEVGENLLDMPLAGLNIESGETFPEDQGTNKEALKRFARELSRERLARSSLT